MVIYVWYMVHDFQGLTFGLDKVNTEASGKHKEKHRQGHLKMWVFIESWNDND